MENMETLISMKIESPDQNIDKENIAAQTHIKPALTQHSDHSTTACAECVNHIEREFE